MAEPWKPLTAEEYKAWVSTIMDEASDELTSWEIGFIDSVHNRLLSGIDLTQRQAEVLEKIYAEKTK